MRLGNWSNDAMKADTVIREVRLEDYKALIRFFEDNNISEIVRYFHPFPFTSESARNIIYKKHQDKYYVALLGDDLIVGLSMLRGWDEGFSIPSFGVMVDYRFHGQGIGQGLLEHALEDARKLGCQRVRLSVYSSNVVALRLYKSIGFYEDARQSVMVAQESDEKIIMIKDLK
jgi:ribosomal protein S18 acetylase RimI-like enzyme